MGIIRKAAIGSILAPATAVGFLYSTTSLITPIPATHPIYSSDSYKKYNVHRNASTNDIIARTVSLDRVRPELVKDDSALALELCRGVWSSWSFEFQRRYLFRKWHAPETASQLWTREALAASPYEPGAQITDHFEVVERNASSITVRCGDSPRNQPPRDSDGLFVISADIDRKAGVAHLALTSCLYNSAKKIEGDKGPMPPWIEYLHQLYVRLLLVSGSQKVFK